MAIIAAPPQSDLLLFARPVQMIASPAEVSCVNALCISPINSVCWRRLELQVRQLADRYSKALTWANAIWNQEELTTPPTNLSWKSFGKSLTICLEKGSGRATLHALTRHLKATGSGWKDPMYKMAYQQEWETPPPPLLTY